MSGNKVIGMERSW